MSEGFGQLLGWVSCFLPPIPPRVTGAWRREGGVLAEKGTGTPGCHAGLGGKPGWCQVWADPGAFMRLPG